MKPIRRWLRRGPSRAELRAEVIRYQSRLTQVEMQRNQAHARAKAAESELRRIQHEIYGRLNQPARLGECQKVQFHRKPEAESWAIEVATAMREPAEAYRTYECKACPRSPVTMRRYWHIGHAGNERARRAKSDGVQRRVDQHVRARRDGRVIEQQVDPRVLAQLRRIRDAG